MDALTAALVGLATAITALAGAYMRTQARNGSRRDIVGELREIKGLLERSLREWDASVRELRREHKEIAERLRNHMLEPAD